MPSPFPGMDPYLEAPDLWPDVHQRLITHVGEMLTPVLRPKYFAKVETRTYLLDAEDPGVHLVLPDVMVLQRRPQPERWDDRGTSSATATLVAAEPIDLPDAGEVRESSIEILTVDNRQPVTIIEVVSPTNKVRGSAAYKSFKQKRIDAAASGVHWVEIDLLRGGTRHVATSSGQSRDYAVFREVQRPTARWRRQGWLWSLTEPVPVIAIPLIPADGEVPLDLGRCLRDVYDGAGYDMMVDYAADPPGPALSDEDRRWSAALLADAGLRPPG